MSIYGALFAGVAGLDSQSNNLGIISDNIANVNTVGYKEGQASFESLVTNSGNTSDYSPGGVLSGNNQQVSQQGLLQSTSSPTDIAISGSGLFVVNQAANGTGQVLYTRAGSFTQDSTGNFENSAGLYLQAWPLDRNGLLPGQPGNLDTTSSANLSSLQTVNVQDLTGTAAGTSSVSVGANLTSTQTAFLGADGVVSMDQSDPSNSGIAGKDIIVPSSTDSLTSGDAFVVSTGSGVNYTYTYGGFSSSRSVSGSTLGSSGAPLLSAPTTLGVTANLNTPATLDPVTNLDAAAISTSIGSKTVVITQPGNGLEDGDTVTLAGVTGSVGGVSDTDLTGNFQVTVIDANHYSIQVADAATSTATGGNSGMTAQTVPFQTVSAGSGDLIVTQPANGLSVGDTVTMAGMTSLSSFDGITAAEINGNSFTVTKIIDANHYEISTSGTATTGGVAGGTGSITSTVEPFQTVTAGSGELEITQPNNNLDVGDYVTLSGMTSTLDGITTGDVNNQTFKVISVVDGNHYIVDTGGSATDGGVAGGAGTITAATLPLSVAANSNQVTVFQPNNGLKTGDVVTLSGNTTDVGTIPANDLNGTFVVTVVDANHYTINTVTTSSTAGYGNASTITPQTRPFVGNIMDASNVNQPFLGVTGTSSFAQSALSFSITTADTGTQTFTYVPASPNVQVGQFNDLSNLAEAINNVSGLSARVVNGQMYVSATDSNEAVTFANGQDTATAGPPIQSGLDWVGELGLANIASGTNRFSTMQGLADDVNNSSGLTATVQNPLAIASLNINVKNPLDTITFSDKPVAAPLPALTTPIPFTTTEGSNVVTINQPNHGFITGDIVHLDASNLPGNGPYNGIPKSDFNGDFVVTVTGTDTYTIQVADTALATGNTGDVGLVITPPNNTGSPLAALGLVKSFNGSTEISPQSTGVLGPAYDPNNSAKNMASGAIPAQFSEPATIYDALGTGHNVNIDYLKTGDNTWAVEVYAVPATDVTSTLPNGQIANGTVTFNGDGSLRSVSASLALPATVEWTDNAVPSTITFDWGTSGLPSGTPNAPSIGKTDGLSQFASSFNTSFINQNGAPVGKLTGVSIDANGYIIASYNNGETQKLYQIPLAEFADPDQLQTVSGNAYIQTSASGTVNLRQSGTSGVGTISSSSLEDSNVDLATQLTDMIVAQRAYQANTKVISTADELLDDLNQILR